MSDLYFKQLTVPSNEEYNDNVFSYFVKELNVKYYNAFKSNESGVNLLKEFLSAYENNFAITDFLKALLAKITFYTLSSKSYSKVMICIRTSGFKCDDELKDTARGDAQIAVKIFQKWLGEVNTYRNNLPDSLRHALDEFNENCRRLQVTTNLFNKYKKLFADDSRILKAEKVKNLFIKLNPYVGWTIDHAWLRHVSLIASRFGNNCIDNVWDEMICKLGCSDISERYFDYSCWLLTDIFEDPDKYLNDKVLFEKLDKVKETVGDNNKQALDVLERYLLNFNRSKVINK